MRDLTVEAPPVHCDLSFPWALGRGPTGRLPGMPQPFPRHSEYHSVFGTRHRYAAWVDGEIGALLWLPFQTDNWRIINRCRDLLADETRIASVWASPAYRGTGLIDAAFECLVSATAKAGLSISLLHLGGQRSGEEAVSPVRVAEGLPNPPVALRFQQAGRRLYIRLPVRREPLGLSHPGGDMVLPEAISYER